MTEDKGILIRNIYYMLTYAFQELRNNNYEEIAGEYFDEIYDLFAEILAKGISFQLKKGLYKQYVDVTDSLLTVRGKINMNKTILNRMRVNQRIVCDHDELSVNNLFNQILKTTLVLLLKCADIKATRRNHLRVLLPFFCEVDEIDIHTIKWTTLCFDRNNSNYQMLLYVCYCILDGMLMTTEKGAYKMRAISDEHMCRLYEKFVLEYYRKHHPKLNARAAQIEWNVDTSISSVNVLPILQTDIMLEISERTLIIDTKYYGNVWQENYDKKTIHSNNLFQIYSYVINKDRNHEGKVDGMLLYAKTQEEVVPDDSIVTNDGNRISFRTLDLNQDFEGIKEQLNKILEVN